MLTVNCSRQFLKIIPEAEYVVCVFFHGFFL